MNEEGLVAAPKENHSAIEGSEYDDSPVREYHKSKVSYLKEYEINIRFLSRGMIIRVGCKEIPFTTIREGMEALNNYIDSPAIEGKKWMAVLE